MFIDANGVRLWFDVDGAAMVPDGDAMRQRPTVLLVHGGPGSFDHSYFKPDFGRLAEQAQELGGIDCPTLVSVGELDPVTPVAAAEEIVQALPAGRGRLEVLAGAGHFPWLDVPDRYWPAIIGFIQRTGRE